MGGVGYFSLRRAQAQRRTRKTAEARAAAPGTRAEPPSESSGSISVGRPVTPCPVRGPPTSRLAARTGRGTPLLGLRWVH